MKRYFKYIGLIFCLAFFAPDVLAQEMVGPLNYNPLQQANTNVFGAAVMKTTADTLNLPFFDDFTNREPHPSFERWLDQNVYVNNTMCVNPISRGVATFDALDSKGIPYDTLNNIALKIADNLTSKPINLSTHQPGDSIYLSFFYQPQGNGFAPETQDSLMLYFKDSSATGKWIKVWAKEGTAMQPFKQVMVPVADIKFFHPSFQFSFVNKASINVNDDVWNVDYVRMAANRNMYDTLVNDIAYTVDPSYILNDYTYMPYHQFLANANGERATDHKTIFQNNHNSPQSVSYGYYAKDEPGNLLNAGASGNATVDPGKQQQVTFPVYTDVAALVAKYDPVNFINTFYLGSTAGEPKENDTIVREQLFHNYFAYDDGTAEKSYFLKQFSALPAKIAIEQHLNEADTLVGVGIYFGRQVPMGTNKYFSVAVYSTIGVGSNNEQKIYQEDFLFPGYLHVNNFYYYKFSQRVPLPQGTYYIGTTQPALGNSDSLYIGLDVNRVGDNHIYFNVLSTWESSAVQGALMIRPVVGYVFPSEVSDIAGQALQWNLSPNPANDLLYLNYPGNSEASYEIYDLQGRSVMHGNVSGQAGVDISSLTAGMYFVRLSCNGVSGPPQKMIKL